MNAAFALIQMSTLCWIENDKSEYKTLPVSDFTPIKKQGGNWNCKYKIEFKTKK